jgi:hypothetical protein
MDYVKLPFAHNLSLSLSLSLSLFRSLSLPLLHTPLHPLTFLCFHYFLRLLHHRFSRFSSTFLLISADIAPQHIFSSFPLARSIEQLEDE